MTTEVHPFDRLHFDVLWETQMYFELFGCEARPSVRTDDSEPAPWRRTAFDVYPAQSHPKLYISVT